MVGIKSARRSPTWVNLGPPPPLPPSPISPKFKIIHSSPANNFFGLWTIGKSKQRNGGGFCCSQNYGPPCIFFFKPYRYFCCSRSLQVPVPVWAPPLLTLLHADPLVMYDPRPPGHEGCHRLLVHPCPVWAPVGHPVVAREQEERPAVVPIVSEQN